MIRTVYLITKDGVQRQFGSSAKKTIEEIEKDDTNTYRFYENNAAVYVAVQNEKIEPLVFPNPGPEPEEYGITAPELYAKAITYPEVVSQIIQILTKAKPTFLEQLKKVMTLATPIVAVAFILFIMAVALKG